jgi:CubicO group peptidase (beta-lactamase class C family)
MRCHRVAGFLGFALAVAFAVTASSAHADPLPPLPPLELTTAHLARALDPPMERWIEQHKGPGAVVVVVTRDAQLFSKGYGFADIEAQKPFTADATLVRPGSISKLFTGIAVMQLVDQGKLDLDRDVNDYIDFAVPTPQGGVPVTLRRLLTHRAGFEEHAKGLFSRDREPLPLGRWLADNLPLRLFPNGDVEAYSNYGMALAGYVVERVSGVAYADYIERHILAPLGMRHSTFRQPLPDDLAPLMARGYRSSDKPPQGFFETISAAPAGGLSATADDMGRFVRALINGGELDGVRILAKARLDEMMAPAHATPAGYLGLVFFGSKIAGHDAVGHDGATMTFFSDLRIFPEQGIGIFASRNGIGEIKSLGDLNALPNPARVIAQRFLPEAPAASDASIDSVDREHEVAGIYQSSRRADSSFVRLNALLSQIVVKIDQAGEVRRFSAIWPFGAGAKLRRVAPNIYEGPLGVRFAVVDVDGSESYLAVPAIPLQRVPSYLDIRWIAPALVVSVMVGGLSLLAWPFAALWRRWRNKPWSQDRGDRRDFLAVKLVLLVDTVVIAAVAVLFVMSSDATIFSPALDRPLLGLYALSWLGVFGALVSLWAAIKFWRKGAGSRWSRVHHALMALSNMMLAWFFLTFHIAGTTLNY